MARNGRLVWYGLGLVAAASLLNCLVFVPPPGAASTQTLTAAQAAAAAAATSALLAPAEAWAKGGEWGPLEGKTSSLVHPFMMIGLFAVTVYSGFLGWQWRRTRLIAGEISDLKKQLPAEDAEAQLSSALAAVKKQVEGLTAERSDLLKGQFKDKHYQTSSILLGAGIFFTTYGVFNTWFRTEKLFPGPHLFAGAAICVLWALAAALVPYMEKGNESARIAHISLNVLNVALFAWQLPTGFDILTKVWGNANLPWF